jgi:hypothetical protein
MNHIVLYLATNVLANKSIKNYVKVAFELVAYKGKIRGF